MDARFFDDEMLTVVLRVPEDESKGRILAQLPLSPALSCDTEFTWDPALRCVRVRCVLCVCLRNLLYVKYLL